jgi:hypothetical protein
MAAMTRVAKVHEEHPADRSEVDERRRRDQTREDEPDPDGAGPKGREKP